MVPTSAPRGSSLPHPAGAPLRIALLGLGTVGGAVAHQLLTRPADLPWPAPRGLELVAVGLRDPERARATDLPAGLERTDDLHGLVARADVDVVVELLGGLDPAEALITAALESGKAVVTANKALLARRGAALEALTRGRGTALRFEAAVGGGIPVLAPIANDLAGNRWREVRGIVNGTTNYMLTAMSEDGWDYGTVLADAQAQGYAEADPSGDVEGRDAADKLALLVRLAFGAWPDVLAIRRSSLRVSGDGPPGITGVTPAAIASAAEYELVIKLLARAVRLPDGRVDAFVMPFAVRSSSPLGQTDGVTNLVELHGEPIGSVSVSGPGAGGPETSSAVLGDLLAVARGLGSTWGALPQGIATPAPAGELHLRARWFFQTDEPLGGAVAELTGAEEELGEEEGGGYVSAPESIERVRDILGREGVETTLYPVLED